jgi:hypothetical protein
VLQPGGRRPEASWITARGLPPICTQRPLAAALRGSMQIRLFWAPALIMRNAFDRGRSGRPAAALASVSQVCIASINSAAFHHAPPTVISAGRTRRGAIAGAAQRAV